MSGESHDLSGRIKNFQPVMSENIDLLRINYHLLWLCGILKGYKLEKFPLHSLLCFLRIFQNSLKSTFICSLSSLKFI